jgi:hypothetical protein
MKSATCLLQFHTIITYKATVLRTSVICLILHESLEFLFPNPFKLVGPLETFKIETKSIKLVFLFSSKLGPLRTLLGHPLTQGFVRIALVWQQASTGLILLLVAPN